MKRGDIVIAREKGEFTGKARPFLIVQADAMLTDAAIVTVCPITSTLTHAELIRVPVLPGPDTGLALASEIEVDLLSAIRVPRIAGIIGHISSPTMLKVDEALRRWLDI